MRSDCFAEELQLIENDRLRNFVIEFLNKCVPSYFYVIPASSSGKYHPQYALGLGGLVRHTKAAVRFADHLLSLEQNAVINELHHDDIIAALILHDTFKSGVNKSEHTKFEHPLIASEVLVIFAKDQYPDMVDVANKIARLIASHMGQWNVSNRAKVVLPKPQTEAEKFVHMCDYLASRQDITVSVTYEPSEEKEEQPG